MSTRRRYEEVNDDEDDELLAFITNGVTMIDDKQKRHKKEDVPSITEEVSSITEEVPSITEKVSSITEEVSSLTEDTPTRETPPTIYRSKKTLGLSISVDDTLSPETSTSMASCSVSSEFQLLGSGRFGNVWRDPTSNKVVKCVDTTGMSEALLGAMLDFDALSTIRSRVSDRLSAADVRDHTALPRSVRRDEEQPKMFWMQLPYVSGITLRKWLLQNHRDVHWLIHDILQHLYQWNNAGVFHNDTTLDNIIIDGTNWVIVDWDAATIDKAARMIETLNVRQPWQPMVDKHPDAIYFILNLAGFGKGNASFMAELLTCKLVQSTVDGCIGNDEKDTFPSNILGRMKYLTDLTDPATNGNGIMFMNMQTTCLAERKKRKEERRQ